MNSGGHFRKNKAWCQSRDGVDGEKECDSRRVRVGVVRSRRRKEADSFDGRPGPPPYVGGYASLFTRHFLYSHPDLIRTGEKCVERCVLVEPLQSYGGHECPP